MREGGHPALDIYSTPQRVGLDLEEARASQQTPQQEVGLAIACTSHEKADATAQDPGHGQLSLAQLSQNFDHDQEPLYQGALVEDSCVLLTTCHRTRNFPDIDIKVPTCPVGTMWDYYGQHKNFTWLAPPRHLHGRRCAALVACAPGGPVDRQRAQDLEPRRSTALVLHPQQAQGVSGPCLW